ncbi:hypothetical protein ABH14_02580 [Brevibacillus brevis]|uniref:hypothetical protein n=1 Tax=Brevibacillus brevis TaxID=1393 RepID=UPI00190209D4|nr:hypothetical protein [Brevibacillus brevis]MBH0328698.1 hypothetical protein [Brevibacillus brevis]
MFYIGYEKIDETKARVTLIHNFPSELDQETLDRGLLTETVPEPQTPTGKSARQYVNPKTKEMWYEYIDDVPSPLEDRLKKVENDTSENKQANLDTQEAVLQLYEMVSQPQPK